RLLRHERPFQPGRESGASAPTKARRFHVLDDGITAFFQNFFRPVPGSARARTLEAPVMLAVQISEDAVLVSEHGSHLFPQRCRSADRCGQLPVDLRTGLHLLAGREIVEDFREARRGQVLVVVVVDLCYWRVDASAKALDLDPRQFTVLGHLTLVPDALAADL